MVVFVAEGVGHHHLAQGLKARGRVNHQRLLDVAPTELPLTGPGCDVAQPGERLCDDRGLLA
jgi:hypothetical protein